MPGTFGDWYDLAATNLGVAERRDSSGWRMLAGLGMLTGTVLGLVMAAEQVTVLKQLPWWRRLNLVFLPVAVDGAALVSGSPHMLAARRHWLMLADGSQVPLACADVRRLQRLAGSAGLRVL